MTAPERHDWKLLKGFLLVTALAVAGLKVVSLLSGESMAAFALRTVYFPLIGREVVATRAAAPVLRSLPGAPPDDALARRYALSTITVDGSLVHVVSPRSGEPRAAILYIHGGAYVAGMAPAQWRIVDGLARRTKARVYVPFYPLAPEADWRAAHRMLTMLYAEILHETPAEAVTLCGDSAGGGLALGFAMALRDAGEPLPGRLALFSPWLDLVEDNPAQAALDAADPILDRDALVAAARVWAGATPLDDPRLSPVYGSLAGLPPILLFSGGVDLLNPDARALVRNAREAGAPLRFVEHPRMTHAWAVLPIPEAEALYDETAAFVREPSPR